MQLHVHTYESHHQPERLVEVRVLASEAFLVIATFRRGLHLDVCQRLESVYYANSELYT